MAEYGFTTGSCAAAAAKAATYMLLSGRIKNSIKIDTPSGIEYDTKVEDIFVKEDMVSCAVRKHSGDDPDVTDGILIYASSQIIYDKSNEVIIEGGEGVGVVTRPGLDRSVGEAAINTVPRMMIENEVRQVMEAFDITYGIKIVVSVPKGEEIALKTFNPRLGIVGGISIIGTSGIVEPMSTKALIDTIRVELRQQKEEKGEIAVVSPGNYGLELMHKHYGYDLNKAVKCSNFIGETIDIAGELGFEKMIITGHMGKLIKLSGGIMNTHSKEADCRMELLAVAAYKSGADKNVIDSILGSVSTDEAYEYIDKEGLGEKCFSYIMDRVYFYINKRAGDRLKVECIIYSNKWGLLGKTPGADEYMKEIIKREGTLS